MKKLLAVALVALSGCASNGVEVTEITADGGSLTVKQKTLSTWGSRTQEGAGSFAYEGIGEDGSSFKMKAGAEVVGQTAGDPSTTILGVSALLKEIFSLMYGVPAGQAPAPPDPEETLDLEEFSGLRLRGSSP